MLKVLLVEDHAMDVNMIRKSVDWEGLCLTLVGIATDGEAALALEAQHRPDIIITDIVMPVRNGVSLAHAVREIRSDVRIIFISGHESFAYAQAGISSGIDAYLVKPIMPGLLNSLLERIVTEHIHEKRTIFEQKLFKEQLRENMPLLRSHFLNQMITAPGNSQETLYRQLSFYGITLKEDHLRAVVFSQDGEADELEPEETRQRVRLEISNAIKEIATSLGTSFSILNDRKDNFVLLFNRLESISDSDLSDFIRHIIANVSLACAVCLTAGIGLEVNRYNELAVSYASACDAIEQRFFIGSGHVIFHQDVFPGVTDVSKNMLFLEQSRDSIRNAVIRGNSQELHRLVVSLQNWILQTRLSPDLVRHYCVELVSATIVKLSGVNALVAENVIESQKPYEFMCGNRTLQEIFYAVEDILTNICNLISKRIDDHNANIVTLVQRIINEKYSQNITVEQIADEIHFSRGYASHVFKKSTGESIARCLQNKRIEVAKGLLQHSNHLISDIAQMVGFENASYFASVFKNETSISPKDYRIRNETHADEDSSGHT
ncbi:MAG: AraC family transcriptional regulator [Bacillota bacterium]|nr:AraC family transcriptional regulator [Bacillota bacterium]